MRSSAVFHLAVFALGLALPGCNREVRNARFRNFSSDTVFFTLAYSHVRWYPESGYDLSQPQRNAGAVRPTLVAELTDARPSIRNSIADSRFTQHLGPDDRYALPPKHTLSLAINRAGAGIPSALTIDYRNHSMLLTPDSLRTLSGRELSKDFY